MKKSHQAVAYCGLHCDDCFDRQGKIPYLARDLRKELRAAKYDVFAAAWRPSLPANAIGCISPKRRMRRNNKGRVTAVR